MTDSHLFLEPTDDFLNPAIQTVIPLVQDIPLNPKPCVITSAAGEKCGLNLLRDKRKFRVGMVAESGFFNDVKTG